MLGLEVDCPMFFARSSSQSPVFLGRSPGCLLLGLLVDRLGVFRPFTLVSLLGLQVNCSRQSDLELGRTTDQDSSTSVVDR